MHAPTIMLSRLGTLCQHTSYTHARVQRNSHVTRRHVRPTRMSFAQKRSPKLLFAQMSACAPETPTHCTRRRKLNKGERGPRPCNNRISPHDTHLSHSSHGYPHWPESTPTLYTHISHCSHTLPFPNPHTYSPMALLAWVASLARVYPHTILTPHDTHLSHCSHG